MKKYVVSLILVSQLLSCIYVTAGDSFAKIRPQIAQKAKRWCQELVKTSSEELQVAYLNLFAFNSEDSIQSFIKCAEYIESQAEKFGLYENLGMHIMDTIKKYVERVQEKIALKKNITEKEKELVWQKLEMKIQELIIHINEIYYKTLYPMVAKRNSSALVYMFDDNGLVPQEKRTQLLPRP